MMCEMISSGILLRVKSSSNPRIKTWTDVYGTSSKWIARLYAHVNNKMHDFLWLPDPSFTKRGPAKSRPVNWNSCARWSTLKWGKCELAGARIRWLWYLVHITFARLSLHFSALSLSRIAAEFVVFTPWCYVVLWPSKIFNRLKYLSFVLQSVIGCCSLCFREVLVSRPFSRSNSSLSSNSRGEVLKLA